MKLKQKKQKEIIQKLTGWFSGLFLACGSGATIAPAIAPTVVLQLAAHFSKIFRKTGIVFHIEQFWGVDFINLDGF